MNTDYPNREAGYCQVKGKDCFVCGAAGKDSCRLRSGAARLDRDMLDKAMQREKTITRLETELAMLRAMSIALYECTKKISFNDHTIDVLGLFYTFGDFGTVPTQEEFTKIYES